jgi:hypothetical protein
MSIEFSPDDVRILKEMQMQPDLLGSEFPNAASAQEKSAEDLQFDALVATIQQRDKAELVAESWRRRFFLLAAAVAFLGVAAALTVVERGAAWLNF